GAWSGSRGSTTGTSARRAARRRRPRPRAPSKPARGLPMWPFFEQALARHRELEQQLSDPELAADRARYARAARAHGALSRKVKPSLEYRQVLADRAQAEEMLRTETDAEMKLYAGEEVGRLRQREDALRARLEDLVLGEGEDYDSLIVE